MVCFSKYSGCGNDFILFDNRSLFFPAHNHKLIEEICSRQHGLSADGIVLLENSLKADFKMRIFNSDGSEAEMCGNGVRCLLKFIRSLGCQGHSYSIETMHRILRLTFKGEEICVEMGNPTGLQWNVPLIVEGRELTVHYLDTGVPHTIIFVDDLNNIDMHVLPPKIRYHPSFKPRGTNVNFVRVEKKHLFIRTYERGVEKETLACGTGATACAIAASKIAKLTQPIDVHLLSQEKLQIDFYWDKDQPLNVTMTGPAKLIEEGEINLKEVKRQKSEDRR